MGTSHHIQKCEQPRAETTGEIYSSVAPGGREEVHPQFQTLGGEIGRINAEFRISDKLFRSKAEIPREIVKPRVGSDLLLSFALKWVEIAQNIRPGSMNCFR